MSVTMRIYLGNYVWSIKYSGLEAQIDESACLQCPSYTSTLQPKSTSLDECLCVVGFTGDPANGIRVGRALPTPTPLRGNWVRGGRKESGRHFGAGVTC